MPGIFDVTNPQPQEEAGVQPELAPDLLQQLQLEQAQNLKEMPNVPLLSPVDISPSQPPIRSPREHELRVKLIQKLSSGEDPEDVLQMAAPYYVQNTLLPKMKEYNELLSGKDIKDVTSLVDEVNPGMLSSVDEVLKSPYLEPELRDELQLEKMKLEINYEQNDLDFIHVMRQAQKQVIDEANRTINAAIDLGHNQLPPPEDVDDAAKKSGFLSMQEAVEAARIDPELRTPEDQERLATIGKTLGVTEVDKALANYVDLEDPRGRQNFVIRMLDTVSAIDEGFANSIIQGIERAMPDDGPTQKAIAEYRERGQVKGDPYLFSPEDKFSFTLANMEAFMESADKFAELQPMGSDAEIADAVDRVMLRNYSLPVRSTRPKASLMLKSMAGALGFATGLSADILVSPSTWVGIGVPLKTAEAGDDVSTVYRSFKTALNAGENEKFSDILQRAKGLRVAGDDATHRFLTFKTLEGDVQIPIFDFTEARRKGAQATRSIPGVDWVYDRVNSVDNFIREYTQFGYKTPEAFVEMSRREKAMHEARRSFNLRQLREFRTARATLEAPDASMTMASLLVENPDLLKDGVLNTARFDLDRAVREAYGNYGVIQVKEGIKPVEELVLNAGFEDVQQAKDAIRYGTNAVSRRQATTLGKGVRDEKIQRSIKQKLDQSLGKLPPQLVEHLKQNDIADFMMRKGYSIQELEKVVKDLPEIPVLADSYTKIRDVYSASYLDTETFKIHNFDTYLPHVSTTKGRVRHPFFQKKRLIDNVMLNDYLGFNPITEIDEVARRFADDAEFTLARQKMMDLIVSDEFGAVKIMPEQFSDFLSAGVSEANIKMLLSHGVPVEGIQKSRAKAFSNISPAKMRRVLELPESVPDNVVRDLTSYKSLLTSPEDLLKRYKKYNINEKNIKNLQYEAIPGLTPETLLKENDLELFTPRGFVNYYPTVGAQHMDLDEEQLLNFLGNSDVGDFKKLEEMLPEGKSLEEFAQEADVQKIMTVTGNQPIYIVDRHLVDHFDTVMDFIGGASKNHRYISKEKSQEFTNGVMKVYAEAVGSLKARAMASPGFVARNLMSNIFVYGLMGGRDAEAWGTASKLLLDGAAEGFLETKQGKTAIKDVYQAAMDRGIVSDFTTMAVEGRNRLKLMNKAITTAEKKGQEGLAKTLRFAHKFNLTEYWLNGHDHANSFVERWSRLSMFLDQSKRYINNGMNPEKAYDEAAKLVRKGLFNYDELTPVEKKYARNSVYFYTWVRKAVPFVTGQAFQNPGAFATVDKAMDALSQVQAEARGLSEMRPEDLPEYLYDVGTIPLWATETNMVTMNFDLPIAQAFGSDLLKEFSNEREFKAFAKSMLNPIVGGPALSLLDMMTKQTGKETALVRIRPSERALAENLMTDVDLTDHPTRVAGKIATKYGTGAAIGLAATGFEVPAMVIAAASETLRDEGHNVNVQEIIDITSGTPGRMLKADKKAHEALMNLMPLMMRFSNLMTMPTSSVEDRRKWMGAATSFFFGLRIQQLDPIQQKMIDAMVNISKMEAQIDRPDLPESTREGIRERLLKRMTGYKHALQSVRVTKEKLMENQDEAARRERFREQTSTETLDKLQNLSDESVFKFPEQLK